MQVTADSSTREPINHFQRACRKSANPTVAKFSCYLVFNTNVQTQARVTKSRRALQHNRTQKSHQSLDSELLPVPRLNAVPAHTKFSYRHRGQEYRPHASPRLFDNIFICAPDWPICLTDSSCDMLLSAQLKDIEILIDYEASCTFGQ